MKLDELYWSSRYDEGNTPWDLGRPAPCLLEYVAQRNEPELKILIPGGGAGHELIWLHRHGFHNAYLLDWAASSLATVQERYPELEPYLIHGDFFAHEGQYDLILEHTFFCALNPTLRERYVSQMAALLKPGGKLVGLLFDFPLTNVGPPFGGSDDEYRRLFREDVLPLRYLARCYNSVLERAGKELFFIAQKPDWSLQTA